MRFTEWPVSHSMEDNSNWVLEVEEALLDEAPPERIRILLAGGIFTGYFVFLYFGIFRSTSSPVPTF